MAVAAPAPVVTIFNGPVAATPATDASVAFGVSDPNATLVCSLDGTSPIGCTSPWTATGLSVGSHTLTIAAANTGGTGTATYHWAVTGPPPAPVTLTTTPPARTPIKTATFAWTQAPGMTYECSLDGGAFSPCSSSITYSKVMPGIHTFRIHTMNVMGAIGVDTVYTWHVA
jgi:hypothetical protein